MYKTHAKIKRCLSCCLLYGGCLHLGGSVKGGSTVCRALVLGNCFVDSPARSTVSEPAVVGVNRVWVSPRHRRRGVASRLMDTVRYIVYVYMTLSIIYLLLW